MARRRDAAEAASETLHEIESVFDRLANWVTANPARFLLGVALVLGIAAAIGFQDWLSQRSARSASAAVAQVRAEYLDAMGATPGTVDIVEPANPQTARSARETAIARYLEVAVDHGDNASAVLARLEAGNLQTELGDPEAALATLAAAVQAAPAGSELRALALGRQARALEEAGRFAEAAAAHETAGGIAHPLRWERLADAARCFAQAGERDRAVALFDRIEAEAPAGAGLEPHVQARLRELRYAVR